VKFGDWLAVFFVLAIVYVLVRPRSKAAQLVQAIGTLGTALVRRATDISNT
jgi:hypothetical protein